MEELAAILKKKKKKKKKKLTNFADRKLPHYLNPYKNEGYCFL